MALINRFNSSPGTFGLFLKSLLRVPVESCSGFPNTFPTRLASRCLVPSLQFARFATFNTKEEYMENRFAPLRELSTSELHHTLVTRFETSGPPGLKELNLFLEKCNTSEDAALALQMVTKYRTQRMRQRIMAAFPESVSLQLVAACQRGGRLELALDALVRSRELGLDVGEATLKEVKALDCSLEADQVDQVTESYNRMEVTRSFPGEAAVAGVVLALMKGGEGDRAKEFISSLKQNGHSSLPSVDALIF
eukprot:CAMPEP_0196581720 /NCGR_PEP_ID=MMETSP1081-20130531/35192_1 /TAXON_ID=36882 /ORGANISM="Pyramimonas amylifera, Strain CCMP720" /LENGTH=250 /DNA_ID=CAMNT_0041902051 /DNA_START=61 /DNA_END=813 /DNA_ORIENTATION=+